MKNILLTFSLVAALFAAGCAQVAPGTGSMTGANTAQMSQAQLQANWLQSCLAYSAAQKTLFVNLDKLNDTQLKQALIITHQITPICAVAPTDLQTATVQITSAVTTIGILAAASASGGVK